MILLSNQILRTFACVRSYDTLLVDKLNFQTDLLHDLYRGLHCRWLCEDDCRHYGEKDRIRLNLLYACLRVYVTTAVCSLEELHSIGRSSKSKNGLSRWPDLIIAHDDSPMLHFVVLHVHLSRHFDTKPGWMIDSFVVVDWEEEGLAILARGTASLIGSSSSTGWLANSTPTSNRRLSK